MSSVAEALQIYPYKKWYNNSKLRNLYFLIVPGIIFIHCSVGFDSNVSGAVQFVDAWQTDFHHPKGGILGLFTASYSIGSIVCLPAAAYLSNKRGRRLGIFIGAIISIIGVIIQTASYSVTQFVIGRIVIGFGDGFAMASAPAFIAELAHPADRAQLNTAFSSFWNFGAVVAAWATFGSYRIIGSWSWRLPSLLQGLWPLSAAIVVFILPESPRWLISKGRYDEALNFFVKYHGNGDAEDPFPKIEFEEVKSYIIREKEATAASSWYQIFDVKGNRRRFLILFFLGIFQQWTGAGLVQTYLNSSLTTVGVTSSNTKTLISGVLSIWSWLMSLVTSVYIDVLPRKTLFLGGTILLWAIFVSWTAAAAIYVERAIESAANGVIALIVLFVTVFNLTWNPLPFLHADEIMTFQVRATGASFYLGMQQAALIFNLFVNAIGIEHISWKYYIVYDVWLLVVIFIIYVLFVETRGLTLESIAHLFDDPVNQKLFGKPIYNPASETSSEEFDGDLKTPEVKVQEV